MSSDILYYRDGDIELWTVAATGEGFISAPSLAKKCGVSYAVLERLAADIEEGKSLDPVFEYLKGDCNWKMMSESNSSPFEGVFVVEAKDILAYLSYFAKKGNFVAAKELQDLIRSHGHPLMRGVSVFEWLEIQSKALSRREGCESSPKATEEGFIYLIGCPPLNVAKIGFSTDVQSRLKSLQTAFPFKLTIISYKKGTIQEEKVLHKEFEDFRLEGEWFSLCEKSKQLFQDAFGDGIQGDIFLDDNNAS